MYLHLMSLVVQWLCHRDGWISRNDEKYERLNGALRRLLPFPRPLPFIVSRKKCQSENIYMRCWKNFSLMYAIQYTHIIQGILHFRYFMLRKVKGFLQIFNNFVPFMFYVLRLIRCWAQEKQSCEWGLKSVIRLLDIFDFMQ